MKKNKRDLRILIIFGGEGLKHLENFPKERVETFNSYKELHSIV